MTTSNLLPDSVMMDPPHLRDDSIPCIGCEVHWNEGVLLHLGDCTYVATQKAQVMADVATEKANSILIGVQTLTTDFLVTPEVIAALAECDSILWGILEVG